MQKFFILFLIISIFNFTSYTSPLQKVNAEEISIDLNSESAVLMEPISKKVIYSKNPHTQLYPASMTKMMGLYLILEAEEKGLIKFDDTVIVSSYASSMGGTQIFLEENEKMSVEHLFKAVAINSANDAIVALGEHLASSNDAFVKMMNDKAKEMGMFDTHFNNATGFDDENHYTTAYDMALLGCNLVSYGHKILQYTSMTEGYVREDSDNPFWLVNTNKLLKYYEGLDGLKTGYTSKAGYNLTATACRNGVRLVSTVMHLDTIAHRSQDTIRLLDYGFSRYKAISLFERGQELSTFEIPNGKEQYLKVCANEDIKVVIPKEISENDLIINAVLEQKDPPYQMGEKVGYVEIISPTEDKYIYDIYAMNDIEKSTFWTYLFQFLKELFI